MPESTTKPVVLEDIFDKAEGVEDIEGTASMIDAIADLFKNIVAFIVRILRGDFTGIF